MNENFSIENLIKIGLIESEAKIYLNLLKKKSFTASEISRLSGISRSKTYEILNQLIRKGLCIEILGGVKKFAPANPKTAFNGLQQKIQQACDTKKILMSDLSETLLPLYHSKKENTDPSLDYIQTVRENSRITEKVESLERLATDEVLGFTKRPYAMSLNITSNEQQFLNLKRGIKCKSIYEVNDARIKDFMKMIEMYADAGEEVKITNKLPLKMYIFDEKIVVTTLEDRITSKPSLTAMVIYHPDLAKTLKKVFYMYWEKAMTLEEFKNKEKIQ